MMNKSVLILSLLALSACESLEKWTQHKGPSINRAAVTHTDDVDNQIVKHEDLEQGGYFDENGTYIRLHPSFANMQSPAIEKKYAMAGSRNINHYIRTMTHDLIENLRYVNESTPVGVASFVYIDGELNESGLLGNQIAESFQHEIYKFGIPVIDFKTTDFFRVTPEGDFILSRDYQELKPRLPIEYVLVGTLVKHDAGHLVNARMVGLESKAVVASAQGFLPENITSALKSRKAKTGLRLE